MAPPTLCIVALLRSRSGSPRWPGRRFRAGWSGRGRGGAVEIVNRFAMPLFLFHTTGMAIGRGLIYSWNGELAEATVPDLQWWLERPLYIAGLAGRARSR